MMPRLRLTLTFLAVLFAVHASFAQSSLDTAPGSSPPAAPLRSPDGRLLVLAVEATVPVAIDRALDDAAWRRGDRAGARADQQVANEGREINTSWDVVWFVRTREADDRWTLEMAIPFRSLRF